MFVSHEILWQGSRTAAQYRIFSPLPVNWFSVFQLSAEWKVYSSFFFHPSDSSHPITEVILASSGTCSLLSPLFPAPHPHLHPSKMGKQQGKRTKKKHIWKIVLRSYLVISKDTLYWKVMMKFKDEEKKKTSLLITFSSSSE